MADRATTQLMRRAFFLEGSTLAWNVIGVVVLVIAAWRARSVALIGFGLDSFVEIGASLVVMWELRGSDEVRTKRALVIIGRVFLVIALYLLVQGVAALVTRHHAAHSVGGVVWTGATAVVMFLLAAGKARVGAAMGNAVVVKEGRVTFIDGVLALSILIALLLNIALNWWWADPLAGFVVMFYAIREAREVLANREGES